MLKCTGGYKDIPLPDHEPSAEELLRYKAEVDPWQERLRSLSGLIPFCGRCLCVCPKPETAEAAGLAVTRCTDMLKMGAVFAFYVPRFLLRGWFAQ